MLSVGPGIVKTTGSMLFSKAMDITSLGENKFKLKGKSATATVSGKTIEIDRGEGKPFVIEGDGEYEVAGISVVGNGDNYVIDVDGLRVAMLAEKTDKPTTAELEIMGPIDIVVCNSVEVGKSVDPWVIVSTKPIEGVEPVAKYSMTAERLPEQLQMAVLQVK